MRRNGQVDKQMKDVGHDFVAKQIKEPRGWRRRGRGKALSLLKLTKPFSSFMNGHKGRGWSHFEARFKPTKGVAYFITLRERPYPSSVTASR